MILEFIIGDSGKVLIEDTQKAADIFIHIGTVVEGKIKVEEKIQAEIG